MKFADRVCPREILPIHWMRFDDSDEQLNFSINAATIGFCHSVEIIETDRNQKQK